jgi:omega-amidase
MQMGIGICYDLRFQELSMLMRTVGCNLLIYPGAFNTTTGPKHWELLLRARATDTQCYVCGVSPARSDTASYKAWGHSTVVDPWGAVIATTDSSEAVVYADLDMSVVDDVRTGIPIAQQKREDVYKLTHVSAKASL